jgi:hypothetical protein
MPKTASLDANELYFSVRWTPFENGEEDVERAEGTYKIRDAIQASVRRGGSCCWPLWTG